MAALLKIGNQPQPSNPSGEVWKVTEVEFLLGGSDSFETIEIEHNFQVYTLCSRRFAASRALPMNGLATVMAGRVMFGPVLVLHPGELLE